MKVLITSLNPSHGVNPIVQRLFDPLPEYEPVDVDHCEAVFLSFVSPPEDFDPDLALLDKLLNQRVPVVVFDHVETMDDNFLLGASPLRDDSPYNPIHQSLMRMQVKAYFKRELLTGFNPPLSYPLYPLDWTTPKFTEGGTTDTREQYNGRPIDVFMSWGYSSESRPRLHGELLRKAGQFCAHFAHSDEDVDRALEEKRERIFALLFTPHYRRIHIDRLLRWQAMSKLSISLTGAGLKCFRCAEASYNSLLVQHAPATVQWSYPWIANENCIGLPNGPDREIDEIAAVELIYEKLRVSQGSLFDLYVRCGANQRNYMMGNYSRNYLLPKLRLAIGQ